MQKLDEATQRSVQKAWQNLLANSEMLAEVIAQHGWRLHNDPNATISISKRTMKVNPGFWHSVKPTSRVYLLAHEACHPIQEAWNPVLTQEMQKEPKRLGRAQDYSVNGHLETDPKIKPFLTKELYELGCFPSKHGWPCRESVRWYFDKLGPQEDESEEENPNNSEGEDEQDEEEQNKDENDEKLEKEEFAHKIQKMTRDNPLAQALRMSVAAKEDAHCITNWREILQQFLWRKAKEERSRKRPSRRWDGKGPVIPGKASREFPKTVLILDYSGSMADFIEACAESVTNLIATFNMCETHVIACNDEIVYEWVVRTNETPPTTKELLSEFTGGRTDMMPAIKRAKECGAELIFCVSDMAVPKNNVICNEVYWITEENNPNIDHWKSRFGDIFTKPVLDLLRVKDRN